MKVFVAGIFTETNTFAPVPTGWAAFEEWGIRRGDGTGNVSMFSLVDERLRRLAADGGHELVLGLSAVAQPDGPTLRHVFESLRDELLEGLRAALPVDAVVLPLHGAMVATGYPDCEGELLERVRAIVGPEVPIGVELDLHCHFTDRMARHATLVVAYKEYPHVDILDRLDETWHLTIDTACKRIAPVTAVFECRMTGLWHTTREPMRSFVRRMKSLEGTSGVLSVSLGHGFPWGDVPEAGAKVWVVADGNLPLAEELAAKLGRTLWEMRELTQSPSLPLAEALDLVEAASGGQRLVLADTADNAGGGASSDSTFMLSGILTRGIRNVALGAFWDLGAVQICCEAGTGAWVELRLGGKCGPYSGAPVDLRVRVRAINLHHSQRDLAGAAQACGRSVWVSTENDIDLVLISVRQQVIGTDLFTGLGIDLEAKRAIVVKSQQHFYAGFASLATEVLYVDTPGLLRGDFENFDYRHRDPNFWPRVSDPHGWKSA